jgi:hypothetical protein
LGGPYVYIFGADGEVFHPEISFNGLERRRVSPGLLTLRDFPHHFRDFWLFHANFLHLRCLQRPTPQPI